MRCGHPEPKLWLLGAGPASRHEEGQVLRHLLRHSLGRWLRAAHDGAAPAPAARFTLSLLLLLVRVIAGAGWCSAGGLWEGRGAATRGPAAIGMVAVGAAGAGGGVCGAGVGAGAEWAAAAAATAAGAGSGACELMVRRRRLWGVRRRWGVGLGSVW